MNSLADGDVIFWHEEFLVKFWTKYTVLSIYTVEAFFKNSVDFQKCKRHSNRRYFVFIHKMELDHYKQAFHLRECLVGHGKFQGTQDNSLLHGTFLHPAGHLPHVAVNSGHGDNQETPHRFPKCLPRVGTIPFENHCSWICVYNWTLH